MKKLGKKIPKGISKILQECEQKLLVECEELNANKAITSSEKNQSILTAMKHLILVKPDFSGELTQMIGLLPQKNKQQFLALLMTGISDKDNPINVKSLYDAIKEHVPLTAQESFMLFHVILDNKKQAGRQELMQDLLEFVFVKQGPGLEQVQAQALNLLYDNSEYGLIKHLLEQFPDSMDAKAGPEEQSFKERWNSSRAPNVQRVAKDIQTIISARDPKSNKLKGEGESAAAEAQGRPILLRWHSSYGKSPEDSKAAPEPDPKPASNSLKPK